MINDISGPLLANTIRVGGVVVGEDVKFSLPEVKPVTSEYPGLGKIELPVTGQYDTMELSITKTGIDKFLSLLTSPESKKIEIRAAIDVLGADGTKSAKGIKAFLTAIPNVFPKIDGEVGSQPEAEITFGVTRYQLYVDGAESILIDKTAGIVRFDGKDYSQQINSLL